MKKRHLFTCAVATAATLLLAVGGSSSAAVPTVTPPLSAIVAQMPPSPAATDDLLAGMLGDWAVSGWHTSMESETPSRVNISGKASRRRVPGTNIVSETMWIMVDGNQTSFQSLYTINPMNNRWQIVSYGTGMDFLGTLEGDRVTVADENGEEKPGNKVELKGVGWEGVDMDYAVTMEFIPSKLDADGNPTDKHGMGTEVHSSRMQFGDGEWVPHSEYRLVPLHQTVDMADPANFQKMMAYAAPGEHHKELAKSAGEWIVEMRIGAEWAGQDEDMVMAGTATIKTTLDGRFVEEEMTTAMPFPDMPPSVSRMTLGYHNGIGKFQLAYTSSHGTGIDFYEGDYDPELNAVVMQGKQWEATFGIFTDVRVIVYPEVDNKSVTEIHSLIGQNWKKIATVSYTRKKTE